ncbi:hypothetical protein [Bacillus toyonensis]|uniref:hypothetical protein n=1 Tax=Bacillus toyonensis TaxID=155322 RepID=UPI00352BB6FA
MEEYIYFYNYKRFQKRLYHRAPIDIESRWLLSPFNTVYLIGIRPYCRKHKFRHAKETTPKE